MRVMAGSQGWSEDYIREVISSATPEELSFPSESCDHSDHIVNLALKGHARLAADHILHKEMRGHLEEVIGNVIRQLNLLFTEAVTVERGGTLEELKKRILVCARAYEVLLQTALNLIGFERKIVGFSEEEVQRTLEKIKEALAGWERLERERLLREGHGAAPIASKVVEEILEEMRKVMSKFYRAPGSMVARIAEEISDKIDPDRVTSSFLEASEEQIRGNIYYRMAEAGLCKFGNDYALGLRWLRHLGFVQVSTNPVLAAIAYDDDPSLWEGYKGESLCPDFRSLVEKHPEWFRDPESHGDEIAAAGTEVSIWPNLAVFRPIAIASGMRHGMVSLQLNPKIAGDFERSLKDALKIYMDAWDFLKRYDHYLLWGYSEMEERGRPNMVFKVSGSSPASIELTRVLESLGIGTNNTVTFTVSQEVSLILAKMEGRAEAVKKGIPLTTVYETNMGGRLDDHIREVQAERLLKKALEGRTDREEVLKRLAEELGAWKDVEGKETFEEKVRTICSRKYLRPLNKKPFIAVLAEAGVLGGSEEEVAEKLALLENDIGCCGILVSKRVYEVFFSPENRERWLRYLQSNYGLTRSQAEEVMDGIDVLPASKRKPMETLETLGCRNMTNTEFPNHQLTVLLKSREPGFKMDDYKESILRGLDPDVVRRLTETWDIRDLFVSAYELTPELAEILEDAGIADIEKYGRNGLKPEEWGRFGSTEKTMREFSESYDRFRKRCVEFVAKVASET